MPLPKAIEAQEKQADELMKAKDTPKSEADVIDIHAAEAVPPKEPEPAPPAEKPKVEQDDYKERLALFKASHDKTVSELRQQLMDREKRMELQARENSALAKQIQELAAKQPFVPGEILSDDEQEMIGDDMLPVIAKVAKGLAEKELRPLQERVKVLDKMVEEQRHTSEVRDVQQTQRAFAQRIIEAKKDAQQVDADPAFHTWMERIDPLSGMPVKELYTRAWAAKDVGRIVGLYTQWQEETGGSAPQDPRETRITPTQEGEGTRPTNGGGQIWTQDSINQLYDAWRRGTISEKRAKALEQDLFDAQREGRIRYR